MVVLGNEFATNLDSVFPNAISEKTKVADPNESPRKNVKKESPNKLYGGKREDLVLAAVSIVLPPERDSILLHRDQSMIGDRHAVGVA